MAQESFQAKYENKDELLEGYMDFISRLISKWVLDNIYSSEFYSMYHPIVNGSLMGKSRFASEVTKNMCMIVYASLSKSVDVHPESPYSIRNWLLAHGSIQLGRKAELNIQTLVLAIGEVMLGWLHKEGPNYASDHPALFEAWALFQNRSDF